MHALWSPLTTAALAGGWMLSPFSLALLGNSAGVFGHALPFLLLAPGLLCLLSTVLPAQIHNQGTLVLPSGAGGSLAVASLALGARIAAALLLPTAVLVTAGYAFNEIFLYWFPNFAFAFLLLTVLLVLHCLGEQAVRTSQLFLVAGAMVPIALLALTGLATPQVPMDPPPVAGTPASLGLALACVFIFPGYDCPRQDGRNRPWAAPAAYAAIWLLFLLWTAACLKHVPQALLAASTVPYMAPARIIADQTGRMLMGISLICGATAAVNLLFLLARQTLQDLAGRNLFPAALTAAWHGRLVPLGLALIIGAMLMSGVAGKDSLPLYLRSALLLWLAHLAAQSICARSGSRKTASRARERLARFAGTAILLGLGLYLLTDAEGVTLLTLCSSYLGGAFLFLWGWQKIHRLTSPTRPSGELQ